MKMGIPAVGLIALLVPASATLAVTWEMDYRADSGLMPEAVNASWQFHTNNPNFTRSLAGGTLNVNTMDGFSGDAEGWENWAGTFDFNHGFVMEERVQLLAETRLYDRWGGASFEAQGTNKSGFDVEIATDKVILGTTVGTYRSYPMDTTDAPHVYRAEVLQNTASLFVDGTLRLTLPLQANNAWGYVGFGDQGWEGGNMNIDYVRYGILPEPATASLALASALVLRRRR